MKKHHIILILHIVVIFAACVNKQDKKVEIKVTTTVIAKDTMYIKGENRFRKWLNDTLIYFHKWEQQKAKYITGKKVEISNDSLQLFIYTTYKTNINITDLNAEKVFPNDLDYIIYLLKDYKEMPKCNFTLSFMVQMVYYPSVINEFSFAYVGEIKDINVQYKNYNIYYGYIRGRLNDKREIKTNNYGAKDTVDVDFIWDKNKLIKKTIEHI